MANYCSLESEEAPVANQTARSDAPDQGAVQITVGESLRYDCIVPFDAPATRDGPVLGDEKFVE